MIGSALRNFLRRYVSFITDERQERRLIIAAGVKEGFKIPDIVKATNDVFHGAVRMKNPIVYDVATLKELVKNFDNVALPFDSGNSVKKPRQSKTMNLTKTAAPTGPVSMIERTSPTSIPMTEARDMEVFTNEEVVLFDPNTINATNDPSLDKFVKTKSFSEVERLMTQKHPVNVYVFGETGVGKTVSALVVGKRQGRIIVRVNCSFFTDIDDLIGGIRIENGNTIVHKGPALMAMELGAVLLLDEIDRLNPQLANEIFPILEGKGYLIKKLNKMIYPAPGFCVVGTGNSKGRGDMTGNYNTQILDKALLDRFPVACEYESPSVDEIETILIGQNLDLDSSLITALARWYGQIHTAFKNGAVTDIISPRRLIEIAKAMDNAGVEMANSSKAKKTLKDATVLMDTDIGNAFIELWNNMIEPETPVQGWSPTAAAPSTRTGPAVTASTSGATPIWGKNYNPVNTANP